MYPYVMSMLSRDVNGDVTEYDIYVVYVDVMYELTRPILGLHTADVGRRYKFTPSLIGWAQI